MRHHLGWLHMKLGPCEANSTKDFILDVIILLSNSFQLRRLQTPLRLLCTHLVHCQDLGLKVFEHPDFKKLTMNVRFVMLGQQGVGKSSIANSLLGYDNLANLGKKKNRKKVAFANKYK